MIASLTGTIESLTDTGVVLNVGGIGFDVQTGSDAMQILGGKVRGEEVHLYTYMNVGREGDLSLYGFLSAEELRLFKMLITVSGIGPKGALSLLSALSADDLIFAILSGDSKAISRAPGVGRKTAERLVLDLRDRLSKDIQAGGAGILSGQGGSDSSSMAGLYGGAGIGAGGTQGTENGAPDAADQAAADAAEALAALGYIRTESVRAVREARSHLESVNPDAVADTEELLRTALRYLG